MHLSHKSKSHSSHLNLGSVTGKIKFLENDLTIKNMEIQKLISQINSGSEYEITSIKPGEIFD